MQTDILKKIDIKDWYHSFSTAEQVDSVTALEQGNILLLPELAFSLLPHETKFLSPTYVDTKNKNISFNGLTKTLRGAICDEQAVSELKNMLQRFMQVSLTLTQQMFPAYREALQLGRTSFRPVEISGRVSSFRKDDTRLHVDAFPANPNQGRRILRVFTNINPHGQSRHWRVGEPFSDVAKRFLPTIKRPWYGSAFLLKWLRITKSYRTEYDHIMLQLHDKMKADLSYQTTVPQREVYFAPGSSWIVQTDHVSHAAMAGQHMLEQTFYLPVSAMVNPDLAPLRVLEKLKGGLPLGRST